MDRRSDERRVSFARPGRVRARARPVAAGAPHADVACGLCVARARGLACPAWGGRGLSAPGPGGGAPAAPLLASRIPITAQRGGRSAPRTPGPRLGHERTRGGGPTGGAAPPRPPPLLREAG